MSRPFDELRDEVMSRPGAEERVAEHRRRLEAELSWTCHVCGDLRPDARISVYKETDVLGDSDVPVTVNVRHCNDRPACLEGAPGVAEVWLAQRPAE